MGKEVGSANRERGANRGSIHITKESEKLFNEILSRT